MINYFYILNSNKLFLAYIIMHIIFQVPKNNQLEYKFYLDNDRFATVGFFNDQLRIGIRQYQKSEYNPSKLFPTTTGISLLEDEWK